MIILFMSLGISARGSMLIGLILVHSANLLLELTATKIRLSSEIVCDFTYLSLSCLPKNYIFAKDRDFWGVG